MHTWVHTVVVVDGSFFISSLYFIFVTVVQVFCFITLIVVFCHTFIVLYFI